MRDAFHCVFVPGAVLRVSGEDALTFLQGQFTNDLRSSGPESAVYGLWLSAKGKVLADSFVLQLGPKEFFLVSYFVRSEELKARLDAFVIADDVVIEDETGRWTAVALWGDGLSNVLAKCQLDAPSPKALLRHADGFVINGRHVRRANLDFILSANTRSEQLSKLLQEAGASLVGADDLERARIVDGIPAVPKDIGPQDLPNEGGLESDSVSFSKGCFTGQEVMARLKSMGKVLRSLVRISGKCLIPSLFPVAVSQGEKNSGELRSSVTFQAAFLDMALITDLRL